MRRTGQTFRQLLKCLASASAGEHIIYQCTNIHMAKWTFEKAITITAGFMEPDSPEPFVLRIGEGTIRFTEPISDQQRRSILLLRTYEFVTDY